MNQQGLHLCNMAYTMAYTNLIYFRNHTITDSLVLKVYIIAGSDKTVSNTISTRIGLIFIIIKNSGGWRQSPTGTRRRRDRGRDRRSQGRDRRQDGGDGW